MGITLAWVGQSESCDIGMMRKIFDTLVGLQLVMLVVACLGCREDILHDLSEHQANMLRSQLSQIEIEGVKQQQTDGGWRLSVRSSQALSALHYLQQQRLLPKSERVPQRSRGILVSSAEREFELERAQGAEVAKTLARIEGIVDARVHIKRERRSRLLRATSDLKQGSASVLIVVNDQFRLAKQHIANLVAAAINLQASSVTVVVSELLPSQWAPNEQQLSEQPVAEPFGVRRKELWWLSGLLICMFFCALIAAWLSFVKLRKHVGGVGVEV